MEKHECKGEKNCRFPDNLEIRLAVQEERTGTMKQDIQEIKESLKESKNRQNATLLGVIVSIGLMLFQSLVK